ncbi:transposase [Streptomyces lavendulae]|uniref:transposase n=1 Tax=Streptomyces lavendulae TaxID=1914 RepID=UPI0036E69394
MHRKQKGSKNRGKVRERLTRLYASIGEVRRDQPDQLTTRLVREDQVLVVEDLPIANLTFGAAGPRTGGVAKWSSTDRRAVGRNTCGACAGPAGCDPQGRTRPAAGVEAGTTAREGSEAWECHGRKGGALHGLVASGVPYQARSKVRCSGPPGPQSGPSDC